MDMEFMHHEFSRDMLQLLASTEFTIPYDQSDWQQNSDVNIDMGHIIDRHCYGNLPRHDRDL